MRHDKLNINVSGGTLNIGSITQGSEDNNPKEEQRPRYVFLSHASEDKNRLRLMIDELRKMNIPFWIDRPEEVPGVEWSSSASSYRIQFGQDWQKAIDQALDGASLVIAFWSKSAVEGPREAFRRELRVGLERGCLVQVLLDRTARDGTPLISHIDGLLQSLQFVDLSVDVNSTTLAARIDFLMQDVAKRLNLT